MLKNSYYIFLLLLVFSCSDVIAQGAWRQDYPSGVSDWSEFIQMVPNKMGPYALPVPSVYEGRVADRAEVEGGYAYYECKIGDAPTHSTNTRFYYPIAKNRVGLELTLMPYESFSYSDEMVDEFHSYGTSGSGSGDLIINTYLQLLLQTDKRPDVTLRYSLRTASGSNVIYARHTDSPGYSFDLSFGKDVFIEGEQSVRFYGLAGLYVWQQTDESKRQNDAILYGLGMVYKNKGWKLKWDLGGYHGYKKLDDSPLVMRVAADAPLTEALKLRAMYENGLKDYPYKGYHLHLVYSFDAKW